MSHNRIVKSMDHTQELLSDVFNVHMYMSHNLIVKSIDHTQALLSDVFIVHVYT